MAKEVGVEFLTEDCYDEWAKFVGESSSGSVYALPEYLETLCTAGGGRYRVAAVRHGEELAGGVALYERGSRFGTYVSPRLLLYYNGPVLADYETQYPYRETSRHLKSLLALRDFLTSSSYAAVVLKARPPFGDVRPFLEEEWRPSVGYSYVVALEDVESIRGRMEQNLRRLVDRNAREGLIFTEDDDIESFFSIHASTMERVGAAPYLPREGFRSFIRHLRDIGLASLFHARLPSGQSIACQLVLLGHGVTHTVCAGADPEYMRSGASAFLRFKVFEYLHQRGYRANDLTDASLNSVTRFKGQLGGALVPWVELWSPTTRRYRWGTAAAEFLRRAKSRAGRVLRPDRTESGDEVGE